MYTIFHKYCCCTKRGGVITDVTLRNILGVYYWCVKIPQCRYMEHGLKYITFYVKKHITHLAMCYNPPLVRDKPLGAYAFVKLVYWLIIGSVSCLLLFWCQAVTRTSGELVPPRFLERNRWHWNQNSTRKSHGQAFEVNTQITKCGMKFLNLHRWSLGMDKWFHPTLYRTCDYLSTLGL